VNIALGNSGEAERYIRDEHEHYRSVVGRLGSISKALDERFNAGFGKIEAGGFFNKSSRVVVRPPGKTCR